VIQNSDYRPENSVWIRKGINPISAESLKRVKGLSDSAHPAERDRFLKDISLAKELLQATDVTLSQLNDYIIEVKKIITRMMDRTPHHHVCREVAKEVKKLFVKIFEIGNTLKQGRDAFVLNQNPIPLFLREPESIVHKGDTEEIELEVEFESRIKINLVGSDFLTKPLKTLGQDFDLDLGVDPNTRLSDLNQGRGVNLGSIRIANVNAGVFRDVDLHRAVTVGDVIATINSSGIVGLSADINSSRKGLKLTYAHPEQRLTVSEAGGTTAKDLGILTNHLGLLSSQIDSLEGQDLNPILTEKTPIFLLKSGRGLSLGTIKFALGEKEVIVDLSSASTIGEIIDAINNSLPGVIASINNSKKGISVESTVPGESLVVSDGDDKRSARNLGISGSPDILGVLLFLVEGLNNQDCQAISESLETLNLSLEEISTRKMEAETKLKRLESIEAKIIGFQPDTTRLFRGTTEVDLFRTTTNLKSQQAVYQSALQRGAAMMQSTLLDFIR
jgi:flagellin-like hook-associated protein FlgL